jgi:hypothetical protein
MLSAAEKAAIRESWQLMAPVADATADLFYQRLVQLESSLWPRSHAELAERKREFVALLSFVVDSLSWDEQAWREDVPDEQDLFLALFHMARRNPPLARLIHDHYAAFGEALVGTLDYALGKRFDARMRAAWSRLYMLLANALRLGRIAAREHSGRDESVERAVGFETLERSPAAPRAPRVGRALP